MTELAPRLLRVGSTLALVLAGACARPVAVPGDFVPEGRRFAVTTENATATRFARDVLANEGGNAVDAAVCATLALGLAAPISSGLGGGGFALVWDPTTQKASVLDFRERAPSALDPTVFDRSPVPPGASVGAPGEAQGLEELARRFGTKPLAFCATKAARLAEEGVPLSPHMARGLERFGALVEGVPALQRLLPLRAGDRMTNAPLARTLRALAAQGSKALTGGPIAERIVQSVRAAGGSLTLEDLAANPPVWREPLVVSIGDERLHTMPAPSGGGLMTAELLLALEKDPLLARLDSAEAAHVLAELLRGAFADRFAHVGDPELTRPDFAPLLAAERLRARRASIDPERTRPTQAFVAEEHGTTHLVVVDGAGMIVSLTTTVNQPFGARLVTDDGLLLNDELFDFVPTKRLGALGQKASPGAARPRARPPSSMTPTLVTRGGVPVVALGGSGGFRIATGVALATLATAWGGQTVREFVSKPRLHVWPDGSVALEPGAPRALEDELTRRGEKVTREQNLSGIQGVDFVPVPGGGLRLLPAADPRKFGLAIAE